MKAVLLAAGEGTRLKPLTDTVPKCLVPVQGTPLLSIWFDHFLKAGVTDVLINTHYLPQVVEEFVQSSTPAGLNVQLAYEETLLGSAGTVRANRDFLEGEASFFVIYADNLTDMSLLDFKAFHDAAQSPFTMGLFETPAPSECGIAELAQDGRVLSFEEKPEAPASTLANAGLYLAGSDLLDIIPDCPLVDFGFDILPLMVGKMYGYRIPGLYYDLGTMERLKEAEEAWQRTYGSADP